MSVPCRHPMKQVIASHRTGVIWWCTTCDDTWWDPIPIHSQREDRVPTQAELPPKRPGR